jgi:hypothetical protein
MKSFQLVGFYRDPKVESHENWSVLTLFLLGLVYLVG